MTELQRWIIDFAKCDVGQEELKGNSGFKDEGFEALMREEGWKKHDAWCCWWAKKVWRAALEQVEDARLAEVDRLKLFSGLSTATYANFEKVPTLFATGQVPMPGAIVIFRYGSGVTGHTAIVGERVERDVMSGVYSYETFEGNTNDDGSREGYLVANRTGERMRRTTKTFKPAGLNQVGFIYPN